jgi:uncharacterized membrane protein
MATPASIQKHPIHPMLIALPIGLWIFSLVCDVVYLMDWGGILWKDMAFFTMLGGLCGALLAAIPGFIDYRSITDPQVQRIGWWHMVVNLSVVALFALNAYLRMGGDPGNRLPVLLSVLGICLLGVSGWLGGEMVYVHGVAVDTGQKSPGGTRGGRAAGF